MKVLSFNILLPIKGERSEVHMAKYCIFVKSSEWDNGGELSFVLL